MELPDAVLRAERATPGRRQRSSSGIAIAIHLMTTVREPPAHPLTEPCNSALITWRWNTMKTISVGRRMRTVPAQSKGMSVA